MSDSNEVSTALYAVNHRVHRLVNSHLKGEKNLNQLRETVARWWNATHPLDRATLANNLQMVVAESLAALGEVQKEITELHRKSSYLAQPSQRLGKPVDLTINAGRSNPNNLGKHVVAGETPTSDCVRGI